MRRCPFCNNLLHPLHTGQINTNLIHCDRGTHSFIFNIKSKCWHGRSNTDQLYIDNYKLIDESTYQNVTLMLFDNISPEEGIIYLAKYLKLKAFS
jgi:hypothetical protein